MKTNVSRKLLYLLLIAAFIAVCNSHALAGRWVFTGGGWKWFEYCRTEPIDPPIDTVWGFSANCDLTISDGNCPPAVLGSTGPWDFSEETTDPDGIPMTYAGIKSTLLGGGTPISDVNDAWLVFPCPLGPPDPLGDFTIFLEDTEGGIVTHTDPGDPPIIDPEIPPELTDPIEIYEYIAYEVIPEPATVGLILLGAAALLRRRR